MPTETEKTKRPTITLAFDEGDVWLYNQFVSMAKMQRRSVSQCLLLDLLERYKPTQDSAQ